MLMIELIDNNCYKMGRQQLALFTLLLTPQKLKITLTVNKSYFVETMKLLPFIKILKPNIYVKYYKMLPLFYNKKIKIYKEKHKDKQKV